MITKYLWEKFVIYQIFVEPIDYMFAIIGSVITIPLDLLLIPLEIIGFILYKIFER